MTVREREQLHRLIDELPESGLEIARDLLEAVRKHSRESFRRALMEAPLDDEPETEEERAAIREAWEEVARGEVSPWEQVQAELREVESRDQDASKKGRKAR